MPRTGGGGGGGGAVLHAYGGERVGQTSTRGLRGCFHHSELARGLAPACTDDIGETRAFDTPPAARALLRERTRATPCQFVEMDF